MRRPCAGVLALLSAAALAALAVSGGGAANAQDLSSAVAAAQAPPADDDRHAGYYYPEITSREVYPARAPTLPNANRARRIAFTVFLTQQQLDRPYPPQYAVYAKGTEGEKLIIVALEDGFIATLFQARALMAQMTSAARATPAFIENQVEDYYTFLDLLALMGFEQLTISDGRSYAHEITLELRE